MKSIMILITILALVAVGSAYALTERHTIVLVSVVNEVKPQFTLRNTETGAMGAAIHYSTESITDGNVSTSFEVVQSNDSNYRGKVSLTVSATELQAKVNGQVYSTEGVQIVMDGEVFGSSVSFTENYTHMVKAGETVADFSVVWTSNASLVEATYEAAVVLNYTAA